jgi:DNA-binding GntR family transcriptional regulator
MPTAAELVFEALVSDILAGNLRPRDPVSERDLVARFGVSRTPIREALKRLTERGFFESGPQGVAVVADMSFEDLRSLYDLRIHLEGYAASLVVDNITNEEIESLRATNEEFRAAIGERDLTRLLEIRAKFHLAMASATRNRWLREVLTFLRDRAYVVRHLHWRDIAGPIKSADIHDEMIDALARRDTTAYHRLVVNQVRSGIEWYSSQLRVSTTPSTIKKRKAE